MEQIRAAVIGCGNIYGMHADALQQSEHACLAAVADILPEKAEAAGLKYGCRWVTDYRELLEDERIHTVHLCVPHYLHAPIALEAMKHGKHVLTEKPVAISSKAAEEMAATAVQTGRQLGVCFQNRYNPTSVKLKALLDSGEAGRVIGARSFVTWNRGAEYYQSAAWRGTWAQEGGGILINQAIHTLDLLQWTLGEVESVRGSAHTHLLGDVIEVEDTAEALMKFTNGSRAVFYATNCYVADSPPEIEIRCEKAVLRLCGDLDIRWEDGRQEVFTDTDPKSGKKACWGDSHSRLIQDFYACLAEGRKFAIDAAEGVKALRLLEAIYGSTACSDPSRGPGPDC